MASIQERMHTGEHILFKSLQKHLPDLELIKISLDEKETTFFVSGGELNWQIILKAEALANKIIKEARPVTESFISKDDATKMEELRIKIDRIKEEKIRVITVHDFDVSACAGEHVHNTKEIENIFVTNFNSLGNKEWEIHFMVDVTEELYIIAGAARQVSEILNTEIKNLVSTITNLKDNSDKMKKQIRELQSSAELDVKQEFVKGINLYYHEFDNFEKKQIIDQTNKLIKEKSIVCFFNKAEKGTQIILSVSKDLPYDAGKIIKSILEKCQGKGGGSKDFAMGSVEKPEYNNIISLIKDLL